MMRQSYESRRESWRVNLLRGLLQVENIESAIQQNCLIQSVPIPLVSRKQAELDTITHRIEFGNCAQSVLIERRNQLSNLTTDQKVGGSNPFERTRENPAITRNFDSGKNNFH